MVLNRDEVDGVPIYWSQGPEPLSATLKFRVGVRDETFRTCGVTHLVEHLAMSTLGRRRHQYNASVDVTYTEFAASGRPDAVLAYLSDVCAALSQLPMDRLGTEAKVLAAENGNSVHPAVGELLRQRHGQRGLGLAGVSPPALDQIDAGTVTAHARRFFVRENAALALTGPPPEGLRLPLPTGAATRPALDRLLPLPLPGWFPLGGPATGVSFLMPTADPVTWEAATATLRIAMDRAMDELRHRHGWLYDVDFVLARTDGDSVACIHADPPDDHAEDVRRGLLTILRDLRDVGPTDAELAEDLAAMREHFEDPRTADSEACAAAAAHLLGQPVLSSADQLGVRERIGLEQCRRSLEQLDGTLIVGMPPDVRPDDSVLHEDPEFSTAAVSGRTFRRNPIRGWLGGPPLGSRLVVGDDGVTVSLPAGPVTVLWADLVGAAVDQKCQVTRLIGSDGFTMPLAARWFRNGADAMELINARLTPDVRFTDHCDE